MGVQVIDLVLDDIIYIIIVGICRYLELVILSQMVCFVGVFVFVLVVTLRVKGVSIVDLMNIQKVLVHWNVMVGAFFFLGKLVVSNMCLVFEFDGRLEVVLDYVIDLYFGDID